PVIEGRRCGPDQPGRSASSSQGRARRMAEIVQLVGVSKQFGGGQALRDVSFSVQEGHIHGLVGENGAGKSTLIKILDGVYTRDSGEIYFQGNPWNPASPAAAHQAGISVVHQELPL